MASISDFKKLEFKVATVVEAADHPDADKLLVLKVDMGGDKRQLVAGIRGHYSAQDLLGKQVVVAANLEPAVLRGVKSEGMLLAVRDGESVVVLTVDRNVTPGSPVS